jgi:hypothetical protein
MRAFLSHHPRPVSLSPEELDILDALMQKATQALNVVEQAERNELAARILSLYATGRSPEQILILTLNLHREVYTPGGLPPEKPAKRPRTEPQR